ncbi:hypothetical protein L5I01_01630 [Gordonia sp. HY442]|uniref:hypothetical protein n=1 Tax=Gordonia zhenghanii TaxID=2911516 RepID=UPI001F2FF531|nr:hypothetical protein [Gordonia zhenghanii]MCF8601984.1 hypothetical protein [Gordonia zhenghanii]MCF8602052.1 hypothetical protein [Gordonia zhenghanii]
MTESDLDEFRRIYERHVEHVRSGDMKAAIADMVSENVPAVFDGVDVPRSAAQDAQIVGVRADGDRRIGESVYRMTDRSIGLRSIWESRGGRWLAADLENFEAPGADA